MLTNWCRWTASPFLSARRAASRQNAPRAIVGKSYGLANGDAPCVGAGSDADSAKAALIMPGMKKPREVIQPRWGVFMLKRKAEPVTGRNSEEAIERAIKEYDVPERERFRISVQREA